jgi:prolyl-tRNA editing enzyme YbaK/EbsC (Cys-tRNA(Pro) deacylase)
MHRNVALVIEGAAEHGLELAVRAFPEGTRTADDAARAIGVGVGQIVKSLVFVAGDRAVLLLVSGANRVDEAKVAAVVGTAEVRRATADEVREETGFPIGGVAPFGHPTPVPCYVDRDLLAHGVVWAAAGTPTHVFAIDPADLPGTVADLTLGEADPGSPPVDTRTGG